MNEVVPSFSSELNFVLPHWSKIDSGFLVSRLILYLWKWVWWGDGRHRHLVTDLCPLLVGSVLQIVSAPGQSYLRPPGPVVMQTVSQAGALNALGSKPPASGPSPTPVTPPGRVECCEPGGYLALKPLINSFCF